MQWVFPSTKKSRKLRQLSYLSDKLWLSPHYRLYPCRLLNILNKRENSWSSSNKCTDTGSSSHSLGYPVGSSRQSDVTEFRSQSSEKQLQMFSTWHFTQCLQALQLCTHSNRNWWCFWRKRTSWQKDEAPTVYVSEFNYTLQSIQPLGLPSGIILLAKSYFPLTKKDKIKGLQY